MARFLCQSPCFAIIYIIPFGPHILLFFFNKFKYTSIFIFLFAWYSFMSKCRNDKEQERVSLCVDKNTYPLHIIQYDTDMKIEKYIIKF